jgi:predicted acetyltransferase
VRWPTSRLQLSIFGRVASTDVSEVRTIGASEIDAWARQLGTGFHFEVADGYPEYLLTTVDLDRTWGSFDGPRVVGTLRSFATALTVPGPREIRASALTNVSVAPTHRRQGRLGPMITADLRASIDRGESVSVLIASEYPIYGRFGYGPAVDSARYSVMTREVTFREDATGVVQLSDRASLRHEAPALFDQFRRVQRGSIERAPHWWDRVLRQTDVPGEEPAKGQVALYRSGSGELEGYLRYEAKQNWDVMRPQGVMNLTELVALSPAAYRALWGYCCGVDLLTTIDAGQRPTDEVLPYLVEDARAVKLTARSDFVWVRVLDVRAALAGRTYASPGSLVIEVVDPLGWTSGRYRLDGGPAGAVCETTSEDADLVMPIAALGSAYLGGVALRTLELAHQVHELRDGAVARADAMFRSSRAPWCTTWF